MIPTTPILYSLQNCPYAMRARLAIFKAHQRVLIRAVKLDNKPQEMLTASPKGCVPVMVLPAENPDKKTIIIEESVDVMLWALSQSDPDDLLWAKTPQALPKMVDFIARFEEEFIPKFDAYSCAKRYHENNKLECRQACEAHLNQLEVRLNKHAYLFSEQESLADIALLPFLRKFARVEKQWFRESPYPKLQRWLNQYLQSVLFSKVMERHELWLENRRDIYFGGGVSKAK